MGRFIFLEKSTKEHLKNSLNEKKKVKEIAELYEGGLKSLQDCKREFIELNIIDDKRQFNEDNIYSHLKFLDSAIELFNQLIEKEGEEK